MKEVNNIFYRMDENDRKLLDEVAEITITDYESFGDFIPVENLWNIIRDLKCEYNNLEEKYEDFVKDVEDNYKPIPYEEQL